MAGRYRRSRNGEPVTVRGRSVPFTFWPKSYIDRGRIATLDPWRCLQVHIHEAIQETTRRNRALAFLEQAEDFHHAASAPRVASKPLLHYYSFLNLVKAFLVLRRKLPQNYCMHGVKEPDDNIRQRLTITSQAVKANDAGVGGRIQIYRTFVKECGFLVRARPRPIKLVDLLEQAVSINDAIARSMGRAPQFFLAHDISFECNPRDKQVWIAYYISRDDLAVTATAARNLRENSTAFEEVESQREGFRRYESRGTCTYSQSPIQALTDLVRKTWHDIWSEVVPGRYRFWASSIPSNKKLAQLAAAYQAMFYFGSVTRYRPDDFHKLADGKHGWMVQEFVNTQPLQFVYFLGSGMMDTEMVLPLLASR